MLSQVPNSSQVQSTEDPFSFQGIFKALPGPYLVLSPDLRIMAASDLYLSAIFKSLQDIKDRYVLDVFPEQQDPTGAASAEESALLESLQHVIRTRQPHQMQIRNYDIPHPTAAYTMLERYWRLTHTPVLDQQGELTYIVQEAKDVTESLKTDLTLQESQRKAAAAVTAAEQHRARLERYFVQAPAQICIFSGPDFVFEFVNPAYQEMLFPGRDIVGKPLFEAVPEIKDQEIAKVLQQVYETGETIEGKEAYIPLSPHDGAPLEDHYFNYIQQARFDENGHVDGIMTFAYDVTELVVARQELQKVNIELEERVAERTRELQLAQAEVERQRDRLERLFMQAPAVLAMLSGPDMVFDLVNPAYQQMFSGRKLLGLPILEALPELRNSSVEDNLRKVWRTGITSEEKETLVYLSRPENAPLKGYYFNYIIQARFDLKGHIDGIIVFAFEVTEQVEARKLIEESEQQFKTLLESIPQMTWTSTPDGQATFFNTPWFRYTGLSFEDSVNKGWKSVIHPDDLANHVAVAQEAFSKGQDLHVESRYRRGSDGTYRWHLNQASPLRDENGNIVKWIGTATDVHDQKLLEKNLQDVATALSAANAQIQRNNQDLLTSNNRLTRTNIDLDNFIYTASHDLKAPILNIEGLLLALEEYIKPEDLQSDDLQLVLDMMHGSVGRFKRTIANLTEIAKLQNEHEENASEVNLLQVVEEVKLDLALQLKEANARLILAIAPTTTIAFTEKNLRSVVYNLLSNALKYRSFKREPHIIIRCYPDSLFWVLEVEDNGLGMDLNESDQLFKMFGRLHDHVEGTGIGLYMVKRMVENAGGKVEVLSKTGEGSTFKIFFKKQ